MKNVKLLLLVATFAVSAHEAYAASTSPLVVAVAKESGITEEIAAKQIEQVTRAIKGELIAGRDVTITNFGRFYVQEREARTGRNPRTGAPLEIDAKRYPRFTSADRFKDEMNGEASGSTKLAAAAIAPPPVALAK